MCTENTKGVARLSGLASGHNYNRDQGRHCTGSVPRELSSMYVQYQPHLKGGCQLEEHLQCLQSRRDHIVILGVCQTTQEEGVDIARKGGAELITMVA